MIRKHWLVAALACCVLLGSTISMNRSKRCRLVDETGNPVGGAFVIYRYSAGTKTIWPWAHHEGPFLTRTGQDGRFDIPIKVRLRFPIVAWTSPVRLHISAYVPGLHNACTLFDPDEQDSYCAKLLEQGGARSFRIFDLSPRPPARFRTLWLLIYAGQALAEGPADQRRELAAAMRKEYAQFLDEYGNSIFGNSPNAWGHIPVRDWTQESGENRPWSFFLQSVPFYGSTMEEKLSRMERQIR